jgi:anti-anti-sigma factor
MSLKIGIVKRDVGVFVVALQGSLDSNTYQNLEIKVQPLLVGTTKALMFDLKELDYISSMGVSVLLKARRVTEEHGANFLMLNVPPQINEVFKIIKALPNVPVFESLEEADRYFAEIQKKVKENNEGKRAL